ncbi:MAG: hypothetical protein AB1467_05260 [Candidatus Diapherotrites archaeon]
MVNSKGKTIMSFSAEPGFAKLVDRTIEKTEAYHSKSEFLRDAERQRIIQLMGLEEEMKRVHKATLKLRKKIKRYHHLTQEERDKLALKYA